MFFSTILSFVPFLLSFVSAIDFGQWSPPGPHDVRSPCPGLNAMANHDILPHSGKGMTLDMLTKAMKETFNFGLDIRTVLAIGGLLSSPHPFGGMMDLDDLDKHNYIEHDGSLSRAPYHQSGDDHTFRQDIFDQVLSFYPNATKGTTSISQASKAHRHRVRTDAQTPGFSYGPKQAILGYGETALYIMTMGDPLTGIAPLSYIRILFEQERLPFAEGWRSPNTRITLGVALIMMDRLAASGGEAPGEGVVVTNNTLTKALLGPNATINKISSFVQSKLKDSGLADLL